MNNTITFEKTLTLKRKRTLELEYYNEYTDKEKHTSVLVNKDEFLVKKGKEPFTKDSLKDTDGDIAYKVPSTLYSKGLFSHIFNENEVERWVWKKPGKKGARLIRVGRLFVTNESDILPCTLYQQNPEEFFEDAFLVSEKIMFTKYMATKWGFDIELADGSIDPGKTRKNEILKRFYDFTGHRWDYRTDKLNKKGCITMKNYQERKEIYTQIDLVNKWEKEHNEKMILEGAGNNIQDWVKHLVKQIHVLEEQCAYKTKKGEYKINRKMVKNKLYDLKNIPMFKEHEDRMNEIIENYKTDNR